MIESEVLERVARGEDNRTEFKENWEIRPEQLAREIVSFANMYGGHILIGVSDSGDIVGVSEDRQEWLMDTVIRRYVHPSIFINYETQTVQNKKIVIIGVPMGAAKPYVLKQDERRMFISALAISASGLHASNSSGFLNRAVYCQWKNCRYTALRLMFWKDGECDNIFAINLALITNGKKARKI